MKRFQIGLLAVMAMMLSVTSVSGQEWGTLKGTIKYGGTAPTPGKANVTKDKEFCGKFNVIDDSLLVNKENNGVANVAVYIYLSRRAKPPKVHPDYEKMTNSKVVLDNTECKFAPKVALVWTKRELEVGNKDTIGHNTKIDSFRNPATNYTVPANGTLTQSFEKAEPIPVPVSCSIHPWMTGRLVIQEHPYMAITDKDGNFEIKNIPAGKWTFQFYHEKTGFVDKVTVDGKKTSWKSGRVDLTLKDGETLDMGTIEVAASEFED